MKHLGIIMDGNRTWAEKKGFPKLFGHKAGADNVEKVVKAAKEKGIKYITLWGLSTDNLIKREKDEVDDLVKIINSAKKYLKNIMNEGGKIELIGDIEKLPEESQDVLYSLVEETKNNTKITVTLALVYGGQDEIRRGTIRALKSGFDPEKLSKEEFRNFLDSSKLPVVDMIVRTGGHNRTSGFLLYDSEYAEFYFTDKNWPEFDEKDLQNAIDYFNSTNRKFGK